MNRTKTKFSYGNRIELLSIMLIFCVLISSCDISARRTKGKLFGVKTNLYDAFSGDTVFEKYYYDEYSDNGRSLTQDSAIYYFRFVQPENGLIENRLDTFTNRWYSKHYYKFGLDNLSVKYLNRDIYRFVWLRTFNQPISITIEKKDDLHTLFYSISDGLGGYFAGKTIETDTIQINENNWLRFNELIAECDFEQIPTEKEIYGSDGAEWILEGHTVEGYRMVTRWSGGEISDCCIYLLELSGIEIEDDLIY